MPNEESSSTSSQLLLDTDCWVGMEFGMYHEFSPAGLAAIRETQADLPGAHWVHRALALPGLELTPLTPEIVNDSTRLPGDLHGDPADSARRRPDGAAQQARMPVLPEHRDAGADGVADATAATAAAASRGRRVGGLGAIVPRHTIADAGGPGRNGRAAGHRIGQGLARDRIEGRVGQAFPAPARFMARPSGTDHSRNGPSP